MEKASENVTECEAGVTSGARLLTEAASRAGLTIGDALGLIADGRLPIACLFGKHATRAQWFATLDDGRSVWLNPNRFDTTWPMLIGGCEFVRIDSLWKGDSFRALADGRSVVRPGQLTPITSEAFGRLSDGARILALVGTWVDFRFDRIADGPDRGAKRRLPGPLPDGCAPLALADLWVMPQHVEHLQPPAGTARVTSVDNTTQARYRRFVLAGRELIAKEPNLRHATGKPKWKPLGAAIHAKLNLGASVTARHVEKMTRAHWDELDEPAT